MNNNVAPWSITLERAKYMHRLIITSSFCCYAGPKNAQNLVDHPEQITNDDFDQLAVPTNELEHARNSHKELMGIIKALQ
jgi:hypothetical protein